MTTGRAPGARTVVVCDDQKDIRAAMTLLLGHFDRFAVVGVVIDAPSCLQKLDETRPDILITDVNMPGGGAHFLRSVRMRFPELQIVVHSGRDEPSITGEMLSAGADVFVVKTGRLKPLVDALDLGTDRDHDPATEPGTTRTSTPDDRRTTVRGRWS